MTDLHCHILPGMDDGAKDTTVSLELLRREYEDGVRNIAFPCPRKNPFRRKLPCRLKRPCPPRRPSAR